MIAAAVSMPPGWVAPGQVSATFADSAQEAERQSVRMSHVETGFAGKVPQPAIIEGTLTADMAQSLATGHSELPGEGPAVVEASSLSPTFEARANSSASTYSVSTSEGDNDAEQDPPRGGCHTPAEGGWGLPPDRPLPPLGPGPV